jgi:flagellar FliL protein
MDETDSDQTVETPKKRGLFKKILLILVALTILGGAGSGLYFWRTAVAAENARKVEEKKAAKLAQDPDAGGEEDVAKVIELSPFIVNLADVEQARYLRMTVSLGVGEGASEKPDQVFTTKVRNAMLAVLTNKTSAEVLSIDGKAKLRKELLEAAQKASSQPEVKAVYITDFIVQL